MVGIFAGTVMTTFDIESIEELTHIPHGWDIVQAPNYVSAGWQYKNGTFTAPFQEGFTFDINDRRYYSNEEYRRILHSRTTDDTLQALRKIRENDKILVAVSGGPDSICLLNILYNIKERLKIELYVAHVNHLIRKEAKSDAEFVKEFCDRHQLWLIEDNYTTGQIISINGGWVIT